MADFPGAGRPVEQRVVGAPAGDERLEVALERRLLRLAALEVGERDRVRATDAGEPVAAEPQHAMGSELPRALGAVERGEAADEVAPARRGRELGAQLEVGRWPLLVARALGHGIAQPVSIEHGGDVGVGERAEHIELARGEAQAAIVVADAVAAEPRERPVGAEHELGERDRERRLEREQRDGEGVHRLAIIGLRAARARAPARAACPSRSA